MYSLKLYSTNNHIKNIVFDFAGVIVDCPYEEIIKTAFPKLTKQEEIKHFSDLIFKSEVFSQYDKGLPYEKFKIQLCNLINSHVDFITCDGTDIDNLIKVIKFLMVPMSDTVKLLKQLKNAGMKIYGLTNMPKEIYDHLVNTYKFFDNFSGIVSSSYIGLAKPERSIYEYLLSEHKISAKETLFLDDRESNLIAARELGIKTILFINAQQVRDVLNMQLSTNLDDFEQSGIGSKNINTKVSYT